MGSVAATFSEKEGRFYRISHFETLTIERLRQVRVLATAHLDHDPGNNRPRNLKALCQRCHMLHDRDEHRRQRWLTLRMRKAIGDLFLGPYRP